MRIWLFFLAVGRENILIGIFFRQEKERLYRIRSFRLVIRRMRDLTTKDHCGAFGSDLIFDGVVAVPKLLLFNYARLELREGEVLLLLQLLSLREKYPYPSPVQLAELMGTEVERVETMLGRLIEQNVLSVEKIFDPFTNEIIPTYSLHGLMDKLSELWAMDKLHKQERAKTLKKPSKTSDKLEVGIKELVKAFEREFGRPLTEIECSNIVEWHVGCGFSQELILEALKRAVLNQITSWKYIRSILQEWDRKNLRTLQDVLQDDANFHARQGKPKVNKTRTPAARSLGKQDKFKDFSL
jgi:DNA replication protein